MNIFTKKSNVIKTICVAGVLIASPATFAGTADSTDTYKPETTNTQENTNTQTPGNADVNTVTSGTADIGTTDRTDSEFSTADGDMDNRLDRSEVDSINREALGDAGWDQEESFDQYDEDGNNYLDQDEYENYTSDLESDRENRAASVDEE